jgi:hypothetical protein
MDRPMFWRSSLGSNADVELGGKFELSTSAFEPELVLYYDAEQTPRFAFRTIVNEDART